MNGEIFDFGVRELITSCQLRLVDGESEGTTRFRESLLCVICLLIFSLIGRGKR